MSKESWDDTAEYTEDFKKIIKQREKILIPFLHASPQSPYRAGIVRYLKNLCNEKNFSYCCLHLAIYILDLFMDYHNIKPDKILLLANVCFILAAKFEENARKVPKLSELNATVQQRYSIREYNAWEIIVLKFFCWYIKFPTVAHYIHYYLQAAITPEEIGQNGTFRTIFYSIHEQVLEYLDQTIDNIHYMQDFRPSHLAAGIIAASRHKCGLNVWSRYLEQFTDYNKDDIQGTFYTLCINNEKMKLMLPYASYVCTFRNNYCHYCKIMSCPKCPFLKKM